MKKTYFAILTLFLSIASFAQKISPDNIIGIWKCEEYKIEIFKNGGTEIWQPQQVMPTVYRWAFW